MAKKAKFNPKTLERAKQRANQVNMMQRSSEEMGKFDNTSATSVSLPNFLICSFKIADISDAWMFIILPLSNYF